ncbi:hypothetical protein TCAL_17278 [Tigriopus californicus]|uniref:C2H2-type domain-containing protein n=2 Tax=Tigriopus californicus TaxID=6832 RepID=A0A553NXM2_TIGCA|nr:hypothetical protein TCAL_17278 [Tigriopus californicus]
MDLSKAHLDWTQLALGDDLQILNFEPWTVITRRALNLDSQGHHPLISMMVFLHTKSNVLIFSVLNRTYKESQVQNVEQVGQLVQTFFRDRHPCLGFGRSVDLPRAFSYQFPFDCEVLVGTKDSHCDKCREEMRLLNQETDYIVTKDASENHLDSEEEEVKAEILLDAVVQDVLESKLEARPLFQEPGRRSTRTRALDAMPIPDVDYFSDEDRKCDDDYQDWSSNFHEDDEDVRPLKPKRARKMRSFPKKMAHLDADSKVPCPECGKRYKSAVTLKSHMKYHQEQGSHITDPLPKKLPLLPCIHCNAQFRMQKKLIHHLKEEHNLPDDQIQEEAAKRRCWICRETFTNETVHYSHKKEAHLLGKWQCSRCPDVLRHGQELQDHYQSKHANDLFKVNCAMCQDELIFSEGFHVVEDHWKLCLERKRDNFKKQQYERLKSKDKHVCDQCGKSFVCKKHLTEHEDEHRGIFKHQCLECDFKTAIRTRLTDHWNNVHSPRATELKKNQATCHICEKVMHESSLANHIANVHGDPTWPCQKCAKSFGTKRSLLRHERFSHFQEAVKCEICGLSVKKNCLKTHMRVTHAPPKFCCKFCGKGLKTQLSLGNHERIHTGENPYT